MKKLWIMLLVVLSIHVNAQFKNNNLSLPPLGWNSWTNLGWRVTEKGILSNAETMAVKLKPFGYSYIVLDGGWHANPEPHDTGKVDQFGQITNKERFPNGIPYLAEQVHKLGLKFGIHIMRGVSRTGYKNNILVRGTAYKIRDVADTTSICPWSNDNYGINMSKPGAQEYYDSFIGQLIGWGVDFIKIDDITEHPDEILAVKAAIDKTGKKVVLSLSPGDNAMVSHLQAFNVADMVRITPDIWDNQKGIDQAFTSWERWSVVSGRKFWIDMDMIPFGHLSLYNPDPDYLLTDNKKEGQERGRERMSTFTKDQKYTFISLRALSASPLMMGGDLPTSDEFTYELITNKDMLSCNQNGVVGKLVYCNDSIEIWKTPNKNNIQEGWIGIFNRNQAEKTIEIDGKILGIAIDNPLYLYNIWEKKDIGALTNTSQIHIQINQHGVVFCRYKFLSSTTYHVKADGGSDSNSGTSSTAAFRSIQKAAEMAQPGDTVLVYAGTYRERVKPPRGGSGENTRITYMAKPGDHVVITGLDIWTPTWSRDSTLFYAKPSYEMFTDSNYVDGGNPYKIGYFGSTGYCVGQVVVDDVDFKEQTTRLNAIAASGSWWADQKTGTIYINFGGNPVGRKVEIVTRRGVFRPYIKGLGYITVQGFDLAYCGNNGGWPSVMGQLHILFQSGLIGTRQGHHWRIINNTIRNAKGIGLTFSIGTDLEDADCWDPHGILHNKPQIEVDYPKFSDGDNEMEPGNSQMASMPYKETGFNLIANNVFESCGMNAIAGIGSVGNTIYGNRFSNCVRFISETSVEDATIKMHMQYGDLIEKNLFENFTGNHRGLWLDNNVVGTVVSKNVFLNHPGSCPTIFFEISSSLDQYLTVVDNNLLINCTHGIISAASDGVAFYNNLFYKCGDGISMGSNREQSGADYGNMRIHSWNNLFVDQERAFGFAYNQAVNYHTSDYNLVYLPKGVSFGKYLLTDGGTGKGPGERPNYTPFAQSDITAAKTGGNYWLEKVNWGADNGPNGCEADLGYWRGTMGKTIDQNSQERPFISASNTNRTITLNLGSNPFITGAKVKKGALISFFGDIISITKAGPFQDLGKESKTYTFWDDNKLPPLPGLPSAPGNLIVTKLSETTMKVSWTNNSPDARFMHIERRINGGNWQFWGYITTTQDDMLDYDLPTETNKYEYRIAARNAAGLSSFAYTSGDGKKKLEKQ